ncbi:MAG: AraC family transcriptional regulator [Cytophagaceae bacterium]|nr:MAG: AraC family transcriptional regulator [Cytophagaceae bacterium]
MLMASVPLFLRMCRLIDAQPDRNFDEAEIAVELHADMAAVRAVTMVCGSLDELVERRRLLAAYRLLCDPSEAAPIATIAWRCGFRSTSRFNRVFRDVFHATPKDLRRFRRANLPKWAGAYHVERKYGALISS